MQEKYKGRNFVIDRHVQKSFLTGHSKLFNHRENVTKCSDESQSHFDGHVAK